MTVSFSEIVDLIDCKGDAPKLMAQVQSGYMQKARESLIAVLQRDHDSEASITALDIYNQLDEVSRARVLLSAELGETLAGVNLDGSFTTDCAAHSARVLDIVTREHALHALLSGTTTSYLARSASETVWSALGDRFALFNGVVWRLGQAAMVDGLVAVDFDSPLAIRMDPRSGTSSQRRLEMSEDEKATVIEKITSALAILDEIEPVYGQLVRNFTRRIIVRKSCDSVEEGRALGRVFGSEHSTDQRGSIKFLNFHLPEKSVVSCAESLLHETIHVLLSSYEAMTADFTSREKVVRPVSPWSGNLIPNSSFFHAIFVYHACHRLFAAGSTSANSLSPDQRREMEAKLPHFASGFLVARPLSDFLVDQRELPNDLKHAIDDLQSRNRAFYCARTSESQRLVA